jgi:uncharacterized cupredoxin-like copper-binding protein
MARFRIGLFLLVALSAVLAWALPAGAEQGAAAEQSAVHATTVTVTAGRPTEFHFKLSKLTVPKGLVIFKVTNSGAIVHDFKIAGKKTPNITPGSTKTLRVTFLKAGKYPYLCTVTGHAAAGMKGTLRVT